MDGLVKAHQMLICPFILFIQICYLSTICKRVLAKCSNDQFQLFLFLPLHLAMLLHLLQLGIQSDILCLNMSETLLQSIVLTVGNGNFYLRFIFLHFLFILASITKIISQSCIFYSLMAQAIQIQARHWPQKVENKQLAYRSQDNNWLIESTMRSSHIKTSPLYNLIPQHHSATDDKDYFDDEEESHKTESPFMKRFKNNQEVLRSKFKDYVDQRKCIFPHTYQKFHKSNYSTAEEQKIRDVRRQKQEIIQEMNRSQNETLYYMNKNREYEKACSILSNKWKKVEGIRKQRKIQVMKLQKSLNTIRQEIKEQKLVYVRKVSSSKLNLTKSKVQFNQRKLSLAHGVRAEKQLHRSRISNEKLQSYREKKMKCQTVRDSEQRVTLFVDRLRQQKKEIAQDLRLSKLFRELAERQEVKVDSAKIRRKSKRQIERFQNSSLTLEEKIRQFRKVLGERRLNPITKRNKTIYEKNRSFTESNDFTSNSYAFQGNERGVSDSLDIQ